MGKILLAGVGGHLGKEAAKVLLTLEDKSNLIFCSSNENTLKEYAEMGIETHVVDFRHYDNLENAFKNADVVGLISMPFVGKRRQEAHKNAIDAAKSVGVKKIVYTSLVNASDETNPSYEKIDHAYTENYVKSIGMDYIFLRNSQFAEPMISGYFFFASIKVPFTNNAGEGHMAFISRKDCAKALAVALHKANEYDHATLDINGKELITMGDLVKIGNEVTGNNIPYNIVTDEETYKQLDAQGIPRTTEDDFFEKSPSPYCGEGVVTFGKAIRLEKFAVFTDDFKKLTGDDPVSVKYIFSHPDKYQVNAGFK